jgi:predicted nucleic acid-binding protein
MEEEAIRLEAFLEAVHLLPLRSQVARMAGDLRRAHTGLQAFDSGSAATALFTRSQLSPAIDKISKILTG